MASLFGRSNLRERAEKVQTSEILDHVETVKTWLASHESGALAKSKETTLEQQYNQDFFIKILGYASPVQNPYTFEPKSTTVIGQYPDAVLRYTDPTNNIDNVSAVVELKGAAISLDRPQQREGNLSPVQQAFKYKPQYQSCPFVIASNFWEFRLYNDNQLDYESWTLRELADPADDYLKFKTWYVLLRAENMVTALGKSTTEKLLTDIRLEQEEIGKEFYAAYKSARTALLQDIWTNNPSTRFQFDVAIQKAQTIIDRIVFACFAEDRGLLPESIVARTVEYADNSPYGEPLFDHLKSFFKAIDQGSARMGIPLGYNGGLFATDKWIDSLKISDGPLRQLTALGKYDFQEDLSVNILGHIFEQSITDLEEIRRRVFEDNNPFALTSNPVELPKLGRRKKEGIFYTPDYIVRYIVDNTLGSYLRAKEEELQKKHNLSGMKTEAGYDAREKLAYAEYQYFLQNVRVLDPACGSGAFLVHVYMYLLAENRRVDDILGGSLTSLEDFVRNILSDNIFGVDLNEESVEITKLSLWLATAQKGKPLTSLDANIRCGNSLVDDVDVVGDKAFVWADEYGKVFKSGGFDVVIGNPPYVRSRDNTLDDIADYLKLHYDNLFEKANLYLLFMERSLQLTKKDGWFGFVVPNSWLGMESAKLTRKAFLENTTLHSFVNLVGESFEKVNVETVIFTLQNSKPGKDALVNFQTVSEPKIEFADHETVPQARWLKTTKLIIDLKSKAAEHKLMDRLDGLKQRISDKYEPRVGLQAYETGKGKPVQSKDDVKNHIYDYDTQFDSDTYRYLAGGDVGRYKLVWTGMWMRYGEWLAQPKEFRYFDGPRVLIREISGTFPHILNAVYTEETYLNNKSILNVLPSDGTYSLKFAVALLNSRLIGFYHQRRASKGNRTLFPKIVNDDLKNYPLPRVSRQIQDEIGDLAMTMQAKRQSLIAASSRFEKLFTGEFGAKYKFGRNLASWWVLDFDDFVDTTKVKITMSKKDELRDVFEKYQQTCLELVAEMDVLDTEINKKIYEVFKLGVDEIALLEAE